MFFLLFTIHNVLSLEKTFSCDSVSIGHDCAEEAIFFTLVAAPFLAEFLLNPGISLIFSSSFDIIRVRDETEVSKSNGKMCALLDTLWRVWVLKAQTCVLKTEFLWGCKKEILSPIEVAFKSFKCFHPAPSLHHVLEMVESDISTQLASICRYDSIISRSTARGPRGELRWCH